MRTASYNFVELSPPPLAYLVARAVGSSCVLLAALLLVFQPVLCVVHCFLMDTTAHHEHQHHHSAGNDPMQAGTPACHISNLAASSSELIPPYWPAALLSALIVMLTRQFLGAFVRREPAALRAQIWVPPLRPPRFAA